MKKEYKIVPTKAQLKIMKEAWKRFKFIESHFWGQMSKLEKEMSKETGIKDLEFFQCDNDWCGIGNGERTMKLIQREKLE